MSMEKISWLKAGCGSSCIEGIPSERITPAAPFKESMDVFGERISE